MIKKEFHIEGMTCASCVARVEKVINKFEGINNVSVNYASEKVTFQINDSSVDLKLVAKEVEDYGYKLKLEEESSDQNIENEFEEIDEQYLKLKKDFFIALVLTIPLFLISMAFDMNQGWFVSVWPLNTEQTHKVLLILIHCFITKTYIVYRGSRVDLFLFFVIY